MAKRELQTGVDLSLLKAFTWLGKGEENVQKVTFEFKKIHNFREVLSFIEFLDLSLYMVFLQPQYWPFGMIFHSNCIHSVPSIAVM